MRLNERLLAAYARGDRATLTACYAEAGDRAGASGDIDAACFFWTQAYVFALDLGDARADGLRAKLMAQGREE